MHCCWRGPIYKHNGKYRFIINFTPDFELAPVKARLRAALELGM